MLSPLISTEAIQFWGCLCMIM